MVILMAILNMTNILPENVKAGARGMQHFFKLCHICLVLFENLRGLHFHIGIIRNLGEILHQEINILLDSPDGSFQCRIVDSVE
jgi:Na+/citrate or Na+/malate symporter